MTQLKLIGKDDFDRLFNLQYRDSYDRIYGNLNKEIEKQKEESNTKGLLHSGYYESIFKKLHLDKIKELMKSMCEIYIDVYCKKGITEESKELLFNKIDVFVNRKLSGFEHSLKSNYSIIPERKKSIIIDFKRELNKLVATQKRLIDIEFLKGTN